MRLASLTIAATLAAPGFLGAADLPRAAHVIVIGLDGFGTGGIQRDPTPNIHSLMKRGAWTIHARGVMPTVSAPNWASMVMGAGPEQHGITSNEWRRDKFTIAPLCKGPDAQFPTVFSIIRAQRPASKIAIFHDWDGFADFVERGIPTKIQHVKGSPETVDAGLKYWAAEKPELLFLHLDEVDDAGHGHGWLSPEFDAAVAQADKLVGDVVAAVSKSGNGADTLIIVTADHGGVEKKHGGLSMTELEIPWIAVGPGVRTGTEIASPVNTYDTAATIASVLGLRTPACWIGRPVAEAFRP